MKVKTIMMAAAAAFAYAGFGADAAAEKPEPQTEKCLKVLMIGNSFSSSVIREFSRIARASGRRLDLVNMFIGGCTLERHWKNVIASTNAEFRPYSLSPSYTSKPVPFKRGDKANIPWALVQEKWDIVTIQQGSGDSPFPEKYEPYGGNLVAKIRELAPQAEIVVQQTWSYDPEQGRLAKWGLTTATMYEKVRDAYAAFTKKYGFRMIPVGTAVQLFRERAPAGTPTILSAKDHLHLGGRGCYLQGLTWATVLLGIDPMKADCAPKDMPAAEAKLMAECVRDAVAGPTCRVGGKVVE